MKIYKRRVGIDGGEGEGEGTIGTLLDRVLEQAGRSAVDVRENLTRHYAHSHVLVLQKVEEKLNSSGLL